MPIVEVQGWPLSAAGENIHSMNEMLVVKFQVDREVEEDTGSFGLGCGKSQRLI